MSDISIAGLMGGQQGQQQSDYVAQSVQAATGGSGQQGQQQGGSHTDENTFLQAVEKFDIPKIVREQHRELVELIIVTKSMDDEERQYWFHILPIMTTDQIEKLRKILLNEQQKLSKLDQEYNERVTQINQQYMVKAHEDKLEAKKQELNQAEQAAEAEEQAAEAQLLDQLKNLE